MPGDREGNVHTEVFERDKRSEPEVAEAFTQMLVSGTSTPQVGKVAEQVTGVAPSASAVSRLKQRLTQQDEAWRDRSLSGHSRIISLDGIHCTGRQGTQTDSTLILTALGVDREGSREGRTFRVSAEERKDGWSALLQDLRTRGVKPVDRLVSDGQEGVLSAVADLFPTTLRQRCFVQKQRTRMSALPKREQQEVRTERTGIGQQEPKEDALVHLAACKATEQKRSPEAIRSRCEEEEHVVTFSAFPQMRHRSIRSTNAMESLLSHVRQRTDQMDAFPTETSCLTRVWAVMQDIRRPKIPVGEKLIADGCGK